MYTCVIYKLRQASTTVLNEKRKNVNEKPNENEKRNYGCMLHKQLPRTIIAPT